MKRTIALILTLLLSLALFAGCGKADSNNASSSEGGDSAFTTDDVVFVSDDSSVYTIVRPENADSTIVKAASSVVLTIKKQYGLKDVKNISDDTNDGSGEYEILIGETNREETAIAKQYLIDNVGGRYCDYIVGSMGNKIVIIGVNDTATEAAVKYFVNNYVGKDVISGGILYTYATEGDFMDITIAGNNISKYSIVRQHYNSSYITQIQLEELHKTIIDKTGFDLKIVEDLYVDEGEFEIVIGDTNRNDNPELNNYNEYVIKTVGNKVFLNGGSYHSTAIAVSEFIKLINGGAVTVANNVTGDYNDAIANYDKSKYFTPTWYDEFDGNTVDLTKWNHFGPGQSNGEGRNGKTSIRSKDPNLCYVRDSKFTITAHQDEHYYYGGMIRTDTTMNFRYGFAEISCLMPDGDGFWIAFWACSNEPGRILSPEIDITEMFGDAAYTAANCHTWPTSNTEAYLGKIEHYSLDGKYSNAKKRLMLDTPKDDPHFGLNFHTFGMLWDKTQMTFTCDGEIYFSYDISKDTYDIETFNHSLYLIVSMAVGFESGGLDINGATAYEWQNTNKFITDSVYVYQLYDGVHELNGKKMG